MLPVELHQFFWEYDVQTLDQTAHWFQIIERILEYGDLEANRWLYRTYTREQIAEVVRNSRNISRRTAILWQNLLGIPKEEVVCLNTSCQRNDISFLSN
ncbi:hypothetical protein SAMN02745885_02424 [Carboxydocella sporoproducens DSM 16521]|uniref:DUF6922 domain-containing protein n=2 Tax=Carboxydocella TaxID=178898 RepID=A0A1T4S436_9FIRM|nr:hypothetical protein CFE_2034 [Carboxydocella thermautotrophica]AVX31634.1 hypothetical protein CTH_2069 [Carboxydocella thermautotrophica]SKA22972.1 hypothetical protein SAMN02745885_02424 [Carboxydocella sporoproducens DSM 16521]